METKNLDTWKAAAGLFDVDAMRCRPVESGLRKWECLRPSVLAAHNCFKERSRANYGSNVIRDVSGHSLSIDHANCGLCIKYFNREKHDPCTACPITLHTLSSCYQPYEHWYVTGNPEPMIELLQRVLVACKEVSEGGDA